MNAGTVEFLLDTAGERAGEHVFIEMNPRIQVEHTVTEEITDVDLVQSQMRIAAGETLADLGLQQDTVQLRGAALQCRITTEDPTAGFRPDTGKITTYRSPGRRAASVSTAAPSTRARRSARTSTRCSPSSPAAAATSPPRSPARGARSPSSASAASSTNIPFLQAVLDDPDFVAGNVSTSFIEERPELLTRPRVEGPRHEDAQLARRRHGQPAERRRARHGRPAPTSCPQIDLDAPAPAGSRQRLLELGPAGFARGAARADRARGHRDHLPRRAPVAARDPRAHQGPRRRRAVRRAA